MGTRWSGYGPPVSALIETSLEHRQLDDMEGVVIFLGPPICRQRCDKIECFGHPRISNPLVY